MKKIFLTLLIFLPLLLHAQLKRVKHVILIGVDGMGANYLSKADHIPVMKMMMDQGAYNFHARCVMPSSSAVNWAAMTMGAGPLLTGYTEWNSQKPEIPSRITDQYGMFPSLFALMHKQKPNATIGVIYSWSGIGYLFPKEVVNKDDATGSDSAALDHSVKYIKTAKPNLLFIHFDEVDGAGHGIGWGTPAHYQAIQKADKRIGEIIQAVKDAGIMDHTIILVSADHGGINKGHGGKSIQEMEIPWIIYGKDIQKGKKLTQSIMTYDTAATIAYIFGLKTPQVWTGWAVKSAFK